MSVASQLRSVDPADSPGQPFVAAAEPQDEPYVIEAFVTALADYYSGDHHAHAQRVIRAHFNGGRDPRGLLSTRQQLFILWQDGKRRGLINLAFKRQDTCKISPLIIYPDTERNKGFGALLLEKAEMEAAATGARQLYCTVTQRNQSALQFFLNSGFAIRGQSADQYKAGEIEVMLARSLATQPAEPVPSPAGGVDPRTIISVAPPRSNQEWSRIRQLLLDHMSPPVHGADKQWLESLRCGSDDRTKDFVEVVDSYVFSARDRTGAYRAAALATTKKGGSLKVMPLAAVDLAGFQAMITDLPGLLRGKGRKAFMHLSPNSQQVTALQASNWTLEALLPDAYSSDSITQQWGFPLGEDAPMLMRIKPEFQRLIADGIKTLEIRVGYNWVRNIQAGGTLVLTSHVGELRCDVVAVRNYHTFSEMLRFEDVDKALPGLPRREALNRLRKLYPPARERLGVVVLELKPIVTNY